MRQITIDAVLLSQLQAITEPVEICNGSGEVLGRFMPKIDPSQYGPLEPQVSEEELERRSRSNEKTYTTAEVLAYLESL